MLFQFLSSSCHGTLVLLFLIFKISTSTVPLATNDVKLNYLFTGSYGKYFMSSEATDVITAQETCKSKGKRLRLLSIENDDEFEEILPHLTKSTDANDIWTSGMETIFKDSANFLWSSTAKPLDYTKFGSLDQLLRGYHGRQRRGIHGVNPTCDCNNECTETPSCDSSNCTVTGETCAADEATCSEPGEQDCFLIEPLPQCTVTCPLCTITRGKCNITQPVCTIGTPNCTTAKTGNCTVIPPQYEVVPGKCTIIQEPCTVTQPQEPCNRPVNCTFQYNPNSNCGGNFGTSKADYTLPKNCSMSCPDGRCENPCPKNDKCFRVFNCVPDLICQAPPVVCPPPIHHCLPAELVKISEETVDCGQPETVCDLPVVECTEVQKKCEEDVISCPPPQTICTPAVTHCTKPNFTCTKPAVNCQKPTIDCPELPQCVIPPSCYGNQGYTPRDSSNCNCRKKREMRDKGPLVGAKCVALKKSIGYQWILDECNNPNYFICEEPFDIFI